MKKTEKKFSIQPLGDRVVVRGAKSGEKKSASGIIIPEMAGGKKDVGRGEVVAVGPGRYEDGMRVPMGVRVGDHVLFEETYRDPIVIEGEDYYVVSESSILAIGQPSRK